MDAKLQSQVLIESLPYLRKFHGETVVIKYGGHAMKDEALKAAFARNIALLKLVGIHPVVVHGGGPQIGNMLEKLEIRSEFREGLRVTDDATMNVVEMVLVGSVNKDIVNQINRAGARAVGLSGKDGMLLHAEKKAMVVTRENQPPEIIDLGNVGRVTRVETTLIFSLMKDGFVPVIAPVGVDDEGHTYNINADAVAGAVAGALRARRLIMLTDVAGVLDPEGKLIQSIRVEDAAGLYENESWVPSCPRLETAKSSCRSGCGRTGKWSWGRTSRRWHGLSAHGTTSSSSAARTILRFRNCRS